MHDGRLAASASAGPRIYLELTRQKLSRAKRVKNYHVKQPAGPWLAERSPFEPRYLFRFPRSFLFPFPGAAFFRRRPIFSSQGRCAYACLPLPFREEVVGGVASRSHPSKRHRLINRPLLPPRVVRSRFKDLDSAIIGEWRRVGMKGGKKTTSLNLCKNLVCCSTEKGAKSRIGE